LWTEQSPDARRLGYQFYELRIELSPGVPENLFQRSGKSKGFSVRTVGRHRINCVSNHYDAGADRYALADQTIRIACTVIVFVVIANICLYSPAKFGNCSREISTADWMSLHQHSFFWRQPTGFSQKRGEVLMDLADIMEQGRGRYVVNVLGR